VSIIGQANTHSGIMHIVAHALATTLEKRREKSKGKTFIFGHAAEKTLK
jgi:hypothetical protein